MSARREPVVEVREYEVDGRKVKEYVVRVEVEAGKEEEDPINKYFVFLIGSLISGSSIGGGPDDLGIVLCQTTSPPSCPSTVPPNGKLLQPISSYQGSVQTVWDGQQLTVTAVAVDTSTDQYNWNMIALKYASPKTVAGANFSYIAYVSTSGSKGPADMIRVLFSVIIRPASVFDFPAG